MPSQRGRRYDGAMTASRKKPRSGTPNRTAPRGPAQPTAPAGGTPTEERPPEEGQLVGFVMCLFGGFFALAALFQIPRLLTAMDTEGASPVWNVLAVAVAALIAGVLFFYGLRAMKGK